MKKLLTLTLIAAAAAAAGCSTYASKKEKTGPLMEKDMTDKIPKNEASRPAAFIRTYDASQVSVASPLIASGLPLYRILDIVAPDYQFVPRDAGVSLSTPVTLTSGQMKLVDFLDLLSNATGYDYQIAGKSIEVRSEITKEWHLVAFSGKQTTSSNVVGQSQASVQAVQSSGSGSTTTSAPSGGSGGSGGSDSRGSITAINNDTTEDWGRVVASARAICPDVLEIRSQGIIRATGTPAKIRTLDAWMKSLAKDSEKVVRLEVTALDVTLNDIRSRGINWTTILNHVFKSPNITVGASATYAPTNVLTGGLTLSGGYNTPNDQITGMIQALAQYGTVRLTTQPFANTLNGKTAHLGSGNEFGYIASVTQTISNGTSVATPTIQRLLIGVELAITPRVLPDGRILVETVPILSNFNGFDNYTVSGNSFQQPRITLQQLATTTIARSGEAIQLGGLMTSSISETLNHLPVDSKTALGVAADAVFGSTDNQVNRHELVLMVTPTLIGN